MSLLKVRNVQAGYGTSGPKVVADVSFDIQAGETVGLVGESGCGKTTLARAVIRLSKPTAGSVVFDGTEIVGLSERRLQPLRKRMQMVFQDPFASLNPRHTVRQILSTPLKVHGGLGKQEHQATVEDIAIRVGLAKTALDRFPHEFSGGQRQRIAIARALILRPDLVVCDEPVSALDLSIQAQILNLLVAMKREFGLSYLFITHDLSVVRYFADRVMVMYLGQIVESMPVRSLWTDSLHPYTRTLIDAVPMIGRSRRRIELTGDAPSERPQSGCPFHPRCLKATDICKRVQPALTRYADGHDAACHHPTPKLAA